MVITIGTSPVIIRALVGHGRFNEQRGWFREVDHVCSVAPDAGEENKMSK